MRPLVSFAGIAVALCWPIAAFAQVSSSGYDPAQQLRALDANGDGRLAASEIPERFRPFLQRRFADVGLDASKPVSIDEFIKAANIGRTAGDHRDDGRSRRDQASRREDDDQPLVPGFGVDMELPPVPGFGIAASADDSGARAGGVPLEDRYHERVVQYVDGAILRRYDRNGDKTLSRDEWRRGSWRDPPPEKSDLNGDGQLTREELCQRVSKYNEFARLQASSSASSGSSGWSNDARARYEEFAKGTIRRYDENRNGVLEENEWRRMSSYYHAADANGDKLITAAELADRFGAFSRGSRESGGGGSSDSSKRPPGEAYRVTGDADGPRFRSDWERLPSGLPDWFTENDANGDGQIAMAEFSTSWDDEKLAEFQQYDANSDGLITPDECLASQPKSTPSRYSRDRRR